MKLIFIILQTIALWFFMQWITPLFGQTVLKGRITDKKNVALPGANVFLKGTYDGVSSDTAGYFRFQTSEKDTATLMVTYVGYEPFTRKIKLDKTELVFNLKLEELANELNTVTITAGAFEASDEKKMTMLKPLDIVTTAGSGADITGVMQLLPGANRVGESTGLFVRGGSALETKVVIDGMIVQNPFNSSVPDVQSRGRFNPFMFKGTSFSTGGYSAQYGQALSSVLLLQTTDKETTEGWSLGANLVSVNVARTWVSDKSSLTLLGYYGNLSPLFKLVKQNIDWVNAPEFIGSSLTYRLKPTKTGILKVLGQFSGNNMAMKYANPDNNFAQNAFTLDNQNLYTNATYADVLDKDAHWFIQSGISYSRNTDGIKIDNLDFRRFEQRIQARAVFTRYLPKNSDILVGAEGHSATFGNSANGANGQYYELTEGYGAGFVESNVYLSRKLAARIGLRTEYSSLVDKADIAPRFSLAYKTGDYSQVSLASGIFWQTPAVQYLYKNPTLGFERADHLILNYQYIKNKRTFRIETFYKNYQNLVKEYTGQSFDANQNRFPYGRTDNAGKGYAQGFDVFFRDQKTFKNGDYWITYSFLDTKRDFMNYTAEAMPTFASAHNVSLIYKYFIPKVQMSLSATYTYTSGRPYYNPNNPVFLADRTPEVNLMSLSGAYLTTIAKHFTVIYFSVDNLFDTKNVFTYRYSGDGKTRYDVGPASYRSFFVGITISLSKKKELPSDMAKEVIKE